MFSSDRTSLISSRNINCLACRTLCQRIKDVVKTPTKGDPHLLENAPKVLLSYVFDINDISAETEDMI